jgi:hypothetical protein
VELVRFDVGEPYYYDQAGAKSLVDALKVSTTGRRDGKRLYYFGAIFDDDPANLPESDMRFEAVAHPSEAKTRVVVAAAGGGPNSATV